MERLLTDRVQLTIGENGQDFSLRLKTNAGETYANVVGKFQYERRNPSQHVEMIYDLLFHRSTRAKGTTRNNTVYQNCEDLDERNCIFEPQGFVTQHPAEAVDQALRTIEVTYPSFFKSVRMPAGEVVEE